MLTIRLQRTGRKKKPYFRVVINEKARDTRGNVLEILGHFDPRNKAKSLVLNKERIGYWLSKGATTSSTVHNILVDQGVTDAPKRKVATGKPEVPHKEGTTDNQAKATTPP